MHTVHNAIIRNKINFTENIYSLYVHNVKTRIEYVYI